jgi:hypothetical protein
MNFQQVINLVGERALVEIFGLYLAVQKLFNVFFMLEFTFEVEFLVGFRVFDPRYRLS